MVITMHTGKLRDEKMRRPCNSKALYVAMRLSIRSKPSVMLPTCFDTEWAV